MLVSMNMLTSFIYKFKQLLRKTDHSRVFVVYGRNLALGRAMSDFLRTIGLKPIEWDQAVMMTGMPSPFIGEIVDAAMRQAQAVIILFTGDDETRLNGKFVTSSDSHHQSGFTSQPRPNVIFESGLAFGKYPKRTIIVLAGLPHLFSDIAGIHFIRLDNSLKARQELAQRLILAGCPVDLSGTDWHDAGNFE
jgi:predicted nucleotide-binding protein